MKYRIKKVVNGLGTVTFYPEYKKFIFWRTFKTYYWDGYSIMAFSTETKAREFIQKKKDSERFWKLHGTIIEISNKEC